MNLCEPYNYQLLDRWETQRDDILEMFEEFKIAFGYGSTLEALENHLIEEPADMAIHMVNCAMTYAAQTLHEALQDSFWVYVLSSGSPVIAANSEFTFLFVVIAEQFTYFQFR